MAVTRFDPGTANPADTKTLHTMPLRTKPVPGSTGRSRRRLWSGSRFVAPELVALEPDHPNSLF
jgi:hypothetical protein